MYADKVHMSGEIKELKKTIKNTIAVTQLDELKARKRVLRRFGHINEADVVQLKARAACEISTGDELLLTELLFDRFFNELTPELCAAILSCFVFDEKASKSALKDQLAKPYREVEKQARIIWKVGQESKLEQKPEEDYVASFKPQLMEVVFAWANGKTFAEIW